MRAGASFDTDNSIGGQNAVERGTHMLCVELRIDIVRHDDWTKPPFDHHGDERFDKGGLPRADRAADPNFENILLAMLGHFEDTFLN
jgi:hypothetical protein